MARQIGERSLEWLMAQNSGDPDPNLRETVREEINNLLSVYRSAKFTDEELAILNEVWMNVFKLVSSETLHASVCRHIETAQDSFFPSPGKIAASVQRIACEEAGIPQGFAQRGWDSEKGFDEANERKNAWRPKSWQNFQQHDYDFEEIARLDYERTRTMFYEEQERYRALAREAIEKAKSKPARQAEEKAEAARQAELQRIARFINPKQKPVTLERLVSVRKCDVFRHVDLAPQAGEEIKVLLQGISALTRHMDTILSEMENPFGGDAPTNIQEAAMDARYSLCNARGWLEMAASNITGIVYQMKEPVRSVVRSGRQWSVKPVGGWTEPSVLAVSLKPLIELGMERYSVMDGGDEKKALAIKAASAMGRLSQDICAVMRFVESSYEDIMRLFSVPMPGQSRDYCNYLKKAGDGIRGAREEFEEADFEAIARSFTSDSWRLAKKDNALGKTRLDDLF
ncbi:MAG: hypothetical protein LBT59_13595 [Clostridiales bacterium]|jgi:hypothetical protein|nr:hypothetical protein [Clostridiales bacterium]